MTISLPGADGAVEAAANRFIVASKDAFAFLLAISYEIGDPKVVSGRIFSFSVLVSYSSERHCRSVELEYLPFDHRGERVDIVSASVIRLPYEGHDDFLDLDIFLAKTTPDEAAVVHLAEQERVSLERIEHLVGLYSAALHRWLVPVLKGKEWPGGFFSPWI